MVGVLVSGLVNRGKLERKAKITQARGKAVCLCLPFYFRFWEAKNQGFQERAPGGWKRGGQPTPRSGLWPRRERAAPGGQGGSGGRRPGQPRRAREHRGRRGATRRSARGMPRTPRASPVPPRGSPASHSALLATSRPQPSVTRSPAPAVKGELPGQREFKATLKPPTATSAPQAPTRS